MVTRVAITGGIACGKSLFSHFLTELGMDILDADDVTHELEAPGGAAVPAIRHFFGSGVMDAAGGVDRRALAEIVFNDSDARKRLNEIVHPLVQQAIRRWLESPGRRLKAVVIPLLFEVGWNSEWDMIICVRAQETVQVQRLMRDRGFSQEEARRRIAAQMPVAEKADRSQIVVDNDADAKALALEAARVFRFLSERFQ